LNLRITEWIAVGFFAYLALVTLLTRAGAKRRRIGLILVGISVTFFVRATTLAVDSRIRDWLPAGDLVLAYWLPALIAPAPSLRWERRFLALDDRWLGQDLLCRADHVRALVGILELCYLLCYPMVPLGFAILFFGGFWNDTDRFWTAVLAAALPCYGLVVWLPMRPPRILERSTVTSRSLTRTFNLQVLRHASIQLNTFPSAHVAASVATTLAVAARLPLVGAALGVITTGIIVGSVARRYHYAVDAITGLLLGVIGFLVARAV
jgi:hypothetical protein